MTYAIIPFYYASVNVQRACTLFATKQCNDARNLVLICTLFGTAIAREFCALFGTNQNNTPTFNGS